MQNLPRVLGVCLSGLCLSWAVACGTPQGAGSTSGSGTNGRGGRGSATAPVPVVVGKVTQRDVPVDITAIGNVEAFSTISVRSQLTGTLTEVRFAEGDTVKNGDHLFTIDPRPYDAALKQAEANLSKDRALLAQAEAQLNRDVANADYAKAEADRQTALMARGIISKDVADQAIAAAVAGSAGVAADRAAIESAKADLVSQQAMVDTAKLQLEYTVIRSPIDGRTGNLVLKTGNLVTAGSTELVTITQVDPVYVTFAMPAAHLQDIKRSMGGGAIAVTATAQDAGAKPVTGRLSFVDNTVDAATDTIKLKATFHNSDRALWPGQFAHVSLRLGMLPHVSVVPAQAVQTGQDGQFVFVVKADSTVEQRTVTTGETADQDVVVTSGLEPGETVVTEGQVRLEAGTRVTRADPRTGEANPAGGRGGRGAGRGPGGSGGGGQGSQGPGRQ